MELSNQCAYQASYYANSYEEAKACATMAYPAVHDELPTAGWFNNGLKPCGDALVGGFSDEGRAACALATGYGYPFEGECP